MTINKFTGKTIEEAIAKAKEEMGEDVVIMNDRQVKPKGFFGIFKQSYFEVTAAIEGDEGDTPVPYSTGVDKNKEKINLSADEEIKIPPVKSGGSDSASPAGIYTKPVAKKPTSKTGAYANENPVARIKPEATAEKSEPKKAVKEEPLLVDLIDGDDISEKLQSLNSILAGTVSNNPTIKEEKVAKAETKKLEHEPVESPKDLHQITVADIGESDENIAFLKILYNSLIDNEVDERYANSLLDDVMKGKGMSLGIDHFLSNIYQKMILKFGNPNPITLKGKKPNIVFFIGPTGVGKTTTIAKVASHFQIKMDKKVALITADTYRLAATEQLSKYAEIIKSPLRIVYAPEDLSNTIDEFMDYDLILIDTAGFSHKSDSQREDTKALVNSLSSELNVSVNLVLSATTKYRDLKDICDIYKNISDYSLIFTKLDETNVYGNLYNIKQYSGAEIAYVTNGQNVPGDILEFKPQDIVKKLLTV